MRLPGAYGYPLWTPELKIQLREIYQLEGLKIGAVGIVSVNDGSFDVLFNITLPRNEQPYPKLIREDFAPVILDQEADIATQPYAVPAHDIISSASIELVSREVHSFEQNPPRADYEFSLPVEYGAVLILPEGAQSCDLANEKRFLDEDMRLIGMNVPPKRLVASSTMIPSTLSPTFIKHARGPLEQQDGALPAVKTDVPLSFKSDKLTETVTRRRLTCDQACKGTNGIPDSCHLKRSQCGCQDLPSTLTHHVEGPTLVK